MLGGEAHVGQHVVLALVHEGGKLGPARAELIGHVPEGRVGSFPTGLKEHLAERRGDHALLPLGHVGQRVAQPMDPAALPGGAEHAPDRTLEPLVGVGDHQLDALEATLDQSLQEGRPERLRLGRADVQADDLAPALAVHGDGDYGGDRDDPAALALAQVGGIEPQVRPLALQRPAQEGPDPLVDLLAQLRDRALGDAGEAHGLDEVVHPAGRDAADPGLLDHRH